MEFSGRMMLCGIRAYRAILNFVEWFIPSDTQYDSTWRLCNVETGDFIHSNTREELCFSEDYPLMIHYVDKIKGMHEEYRAAVHWSEVHRDGYRVQDLFESPRAPWLFIGYQDGDDIIDFTGFMSSFVCAGNLIHIDLLHYLIPESREKPWVYIHPTTFEQTEFPSDGILIGEKNEERSEEDDKKND
jgi:hypothetical protein